MHDELHVAHRFGRDRDDARYLAHVADVGDDRVRFAVRGSDAPRGFLELAAGAGHEHHTPPAYGEAKREGPPEPTPRPCDECRSFVLHAPSMERALQYIRHPANPLE